MSEQMLKKCAKLQEQIDKIFKKLDEIKNMNKPNKIKESDVNINELGVRRKKNKSGVRSKKNELGEIPWNYGNRKKKI